MSDEYEVVLSGGGPYGFRLQGGKEFGRSLAIQSITPGGKADNQGICSGDSLIAINDQLTDNMTHIEAQNAIKRSQTLKLNLKRKPGNIAVSMGSKSPIISTKITHSDKVDHKYNSQPKPFSPVQGPIKSSAPTKSSAPVKASAPVKSLKSSAPPDEKKEDNLEDSEVLKMLRNSNLSDESTGLRHTTNGKILNSDSDDNENDELPPPPPEAYEAHERNEGHQSRTFRLLEKTMNAGDDHPSSLSKETVNPPTTNHLRGPKPYNSPSQTWTPQSGTIKSGPTPIPANKKQQKPFEASPPPPKPAPSKPLPQATPGITSPPKPKPGSTVCDKCGEAIQGPFVSALGRTWDPNCFRCAGCDKSLQNIGFIEEAGKMYCEDCYNEQLAPKCAKCNQPVVGMSVKALGKLYHEECFTCTHCGKKLAGEGFNVENGEPYCGYHYKELFSVKCYSCKQIIRAGDRWLDAVNEKWHVDCYRLKMLYR